MRGRGGGARPAAAQSWRARSATVQVVRVDAGRTLGAVLGAAAAAATGALLAKMDDDDLYGPEHLWDLALAHEYSGAALIGKFPATVYLAGRDCTVRQRAVPAEVPSTSITGGALLIGRDALARAGGWRDLPHGVDKALIDDMQRRGEGVYRTHDLGYLLVRHGRGHTWERKDAAFLAGAGQVLPGWRPDLAGITGAAAQGAPPDLVVDSIAGRPSRAKAEGHEAGRADPDEPFIPESSTADKEDFHG